MSGNRIISPDILDTEIFDAQELSSDGYSSYLTLPLVSISSGIFTVDPTGVLSGGLTIDPETPVESGDRIYVEGATPGSADGYYTIDDLLSTTTFDVLESSINSTGGNVFFFHPSGAARIGFDSSNLIEITADNVQEALEQIDDSLINKADISHADTHIKDGYDEVDGDQLDIDFTPLNYTPVTTPPEVTDLDHLSAHLAGIDEALNLDDRPSIDVYDGAGSLVISTTGVFFDVVLDSVRENSGDFTHSSGVITCLTAGLYLVNGRFSALISSGSSRTQADVRLTRDSGSGFTPVPGTTGELYLRLTSYGATGSFTCLLDLSVGDQIKMEARRTAGSGTITAEADGSGLTITSLSGSPGEQGPPGAGSTIIVEDDDVIINGAVTNLNFGDNLEVTDDGYGQVTVDGYNAGRAVFVIWAEEAANLGGNYEWAFGNGDDTPSGSGIPVPLDCVLFAVGLDHGTTASATVAIEADGVQIATVTTSSQRNILTTLGSPVNVNQGQVIGFQTLTGSGSSDGNRVSAYFRTAPFAAGAPVDSVFGRTGAVLAQASDYDANQIDFTPNGDIAATDVQAAIIEVRDDADTKLTGKVDTSTQIIAGDGLIGGGDLSTDRTLDVVANADGSIVVNANDIQVGVLANDSQHGDLGGGNLHADATTTVAGFLSATDKTKLDGIEAGAEVNTVDSVFGRTGAVVALTSDYDANQVDFTPNGDIAATDVQAAIVEVRDDTDTKLTGKADVIHAPTHLPSGADPLTTAAASTLTPDLANAEGTAESFARSDHIHNVPADTAINIGAGGTSSEGSSANFARADHIHRIIDPSSEVTSLTTESTTSTTPVLIPGMTITPGAGTYIVLFNSYGEHSNNFANGVVTIFANGVSQDQSTISWGGNQFSDGMQFPLSCQCKVTIGAGQDIDVRFNRSGGSGSISVFEKSLVIIKVDD